MILHDPYALHRKWWDMDWEPSFGDDKWTDWDYVLAEAYQVIDDYTDKSTGQYMPYDQSPEVDWDTDSTYSGSQAAIEKASKGRELEPGESLFAFPIFRDPNNKPTLSSWIEDLSQGRVNAVPEEHQGARPPTAAELAALMSNPQEMVE